MKVSKDALRNAKQLFKLSFSENGRLDLGRVTAIVGRVASGKPRGYLAILTALQRLVRLEVEKRHAVIESAVELGAQTADAVGSDLRLKYGDDLTTEFKVTPELIGGMRVRVGSDVWDGSVKGRLEALADRI